MSFLSRVTRHKWPPSQDITVPLPEGKAWIALGWIGQWVDCNNERFEHVSGATIMLESDIKIQNSLKQKSESTNVSPDE